MANPLGIPLCEAGRTAFFSGQWDNIPPCTALGRNCIHGLGQRVRFLDRSVIYLCDGHFHEVNAAGLIIEPFAGHREPGGEWQPGPPPEMQ